MRTRLVQNWLNGIIDHYKAVISEQRNRSKKKIYKKILQGLQKAKNLHEKQRSEKLKQWQNMTVEAIGNRLSYLIREIPSSRFGIERAIMRGDLRTSLCSYPDAGLISWDLQLITKKCGNLFELEWELKELERIFIKICRHSADEQCLENIRELVEEYRKQFSGKFTAIPIKQYYKDRIEYYDKLQKEIENIRKYKQQNVDWLYQADFCLRQFKNENQMGSSLNILNDVTKKLLIFLNLAEQNNQMTKRNAAKLDLGDLKYLLDFYSCRKEELIAKGSDLPREIGEILQELWSKYWKLYSIARSIKLFDIVKLSAAVVVGVFFFFLTMELHESGSWLAYVSGIIPVAMAFYFVASMFSLIHYKQVRVTRTMKINNVVGLVISIILLFMLYILLRNINEGNILMRVISSIITILWFASFIAVIYFIYAIIKSILEKRKRESNTKS